MRQILLTASILLGAAGTASAQAVVRVVPPAPVAPPAPAPPAPVAPAPPAPVAPPAPIVHVNPEDLFHVNLDVESLKELASLSHVNWEAESARWAEEGARWAAEGARWAEQFAFAEQSFQPFQKGTQIDAQYSQARSFIDSNQYDRALGPLDRVITAKAERADGAMYWKAYTLYKLARRDEAVATVNQLAKEFPQSPWVRDARALEVEMKQSAGQAVGADSSDDDVKLLAMQGIMRSNPDAAFPVIEKMLAGSGNVRLKDRALYVLSQNRSERSRTILANVAKGNANPDLQRAAIRYLGQSNSPDAIATLSSLYRPDQPVEVHRAIVSSLRQNHNNTAATNALIAIAKAERDLELKKELIRHLSDSRTPEAQQYMLELIK